VEDPGGDVVGVFCYGGIVVGLPGYVDPGLELDIAMRWDHHDVPPGADHVGHGTVWDRNFIGLPVCFGAVGIFVQITGGPAVGGVVVELTDFGDKERTDVDVERVEDAGVVDEYPLLGGLSLGLT